MLVSTGSKTCIYRALMALLSPGDEVLVQEPYWLSYPAQVKLAGGVPVAIPHFTTLSGFEEWFTPKTKVVILNHPNNPAGNVLSEQALRHILALCRKHGATLLVDEAYSDFCVDGALRARRRCCRCIAIGTSTTSCSA